MKFTLRNQGPPLAPDDILVFEFEIRGQLPDDYKQFLFRSNGGMCDIRLGFDWHGAIREIPGFNKLLPDRDKGLRRAPRELHELGCHGYLPIASDMNQQDICIRYVKDIGRIFFSEYAYENYVEVGVAMHPLADSFSEFLDLLVEIEDPFCPVEDLGKNGSPADLHAYLDQGGSLDAIGKNNLTIICEAIKFRNAPMFDACLERSINLTGSIHIAAFNHQPQLIKILVDAGADVNEADCYGRLPLDYVGGTALPGEEGARNREVRDTLVKHGARSSRDMSQ